MENRADKRGGAKAAKNRRVKLAADQAPFRDGITSNDRPYFPLIDLYPVLEHDSFVDISRDKGSVHNNLNSVIDSEVCSKKNREVTER